MVQYTTLKGGLYGTVHYTEGGGSKVQYTTLKGGALRYSTLH